jgi:hypothetical protein
VVGISWYARNESIQAKRTHRDSWIDRIPILFLFAAPLLALAYLVLWNNLDPIRTFLVNLVGLLAGGVAFFAILEMRKAKKVPLGKGFPCSSQGSVRWMPPSFLFMLPYWLDPASSSEHLL